ncbi:hypothetical protein [Reinekea sp. G2M2-21]|uniref:hypothetical protein n=1 Tax=Reinekea sp. G2M2-21 TaxID=2788942 RepID=UPI0018A9D0B3|nr:hypothetical protein [Reinekea sp. G2M2-21]
MSKTIFSAKLNAVDGFNEPVPVQGIPGWTVFKKRQSEIYEVTHNLGLSHPELEFQVVATPMSDNARVVVESVDENSFTLSTWSVKSGGAMQTDLMFIASSSISPPSSPQLNNS